ncbi:unnamed protein product [Microthlaspi erraticum]|uniref:F-box domain-containing protein n=1 Tax=Microthlaspi erraticum TaxID=1685480 RepID=A0A6D2IXA1_9BRAS|nr:unnamed protein product [Microthlaspi erraticum]
MNSIPIDLVLEIFSRLPPNSIARCCCVSKQWRYMLQSQDFTKLFLTRSSARPRLLFVMIGFRDGKLGGIDWKNNNGNYATENGAIELYVLEDVEKQEWSKYVYILPENEIVEWKREPISIVGVTAMGEIVLSSYSFRYKPFYVFYFNPEKNTFKSVEIQGFGEYYEEGGWDAYNNKFFAFVDYVEDLTFDVKKMLYAATSSKAHLRQDRHTSESINNFDALCLIDDDNCIKSYFNYFTYFAGKLKALFKYIWYSRSREELILYENRG